MLNNIALFLFLLFLGSGVHAAWTPAAKVLSIRAYPAGDAHYIKMATASVNESCSGTQGMGIYYLNDSTGRIFAILLAAKSSNQLVKLHVSGCVGGPYANITEVQLGDTVWTDVVNN
ncbi:hypothetical protein ACU6U9_01760 [Pseudomonas sp. HK3]